MNPHQRRATNMVQSHLVEARTRISRAKHEMASSGLNAHACEAYGALLTEADGMIETALNAVLDAAHQEGA